MGRIMDIHDLNTDIHTLNYGYPSIVLVVSIIRISVTRKSDYWIFVIRISLIRIMGMHKLFMDITKFELWILLFQIIDIHK